VLKIFCTWFSWLERVDIILCNLYTSANLSVKITWWCICSQSQSFVEKLWIYSIFLGKSCFSLAILPICFVQCVLKVLEYCLDLFWTRTVALSFFLSEQNSPHHSFTPPVLCHTVLLLYIISRQDTCYTVWRVPNSTISDHIRHFDDLKECCVEYIQETNCSEFHILSKNLSKLSAVVLDWTKIHLNEYIKWDKLDC